MERNNWWLPAAGMAVAGALAATACSGVPGSAGTNGLPTAPSVLRASADESHGLPLTVVTGSGEGMVNVTPNARGGIYAVNTRDTINVHGVPPGTVLYVRAAADAGLGAQQADGVCQRANLGFFQPLLSTPGGAPAVLEASAGGAGATQIDFGSALLPEGAALDLVIRLVDALPPAVPTIDLRTECFTLQTK
jgi:hypothetical protein